MFRGHKTWQGLYLMTDPMASVRTSFESLNALVRTKADVAPLATIIIA